jgi:hypothetical protein
MQLPLQLPHAFLLDIDALGDLDPDPHLDLFDSESIEAPALCSLPTFDTVDYRYYRKRS